MIADRVKLPVQLDAARLRGDVDGLQLHAFIEYSVIPMTHPVPRVDPDTGLPVEVTDYADGSWATWAASSMLVACPYLSELVDAFRQHTRVTLVRLLRLAPGGHIATHVDPTLGLEVERSVVRLTVPIVVPTGAELRLNGDAVPLHPGECWYLRFTDPHEVFNRGSSERVHLSIDLEPNAWLRSLVAGEVSLTL